MRIIRKVYWRMRFDSEHTDDFDGWLCLLTRRQTILLNFWVWRKLSCMCFCHVFFITIEVIACEFADSFAFFCTTHPRVSTSTTSTAIPCAYRHNQCWTKHYNTANPTEKNGLYVIFYFLELSEQITRHHTVHLIELFVQISDYHNLIYYTTEVVYYSAREFLTSLLKIWSRQTPAMSILGTVGTIAVITAGTL